MFSTGQVFPQQSCHDSMTLITPVPSVVADRLWCEEVPYKLKHIRAGLPKIYYRLFEKTYFFQ